MVNEILNIQNRHCMGYDTLFKFTFHSISDDIKKLSYSVYSYEKGDMDLFLKQHGFDINNSYVECLPINDANIVGDNVLLQKHKFRSNILHEDVVIMTSPKIVEGAIESVCSDLSESLVFGYASLRADIEIIKIINDLIYKLDHVLVLDHSMIDDGGFLISPYYENYQKSMSPSLDDGLSVDCLNDTYIYDSMFSKSSINATQPITVEAYVKYFTSMMIDKFN
jgi:hypothetical protein